MALERKVTHPDILVAIQHGIESGLKQVVGDAYEQAKKELVEKLDREKDKEIAAIVIRLMAMTDFQMMQDRLVISVKEDVSK